MSLNKLGVGAAIVAASAAIVVGGSALANAAAGSSLATGSAGYGASGYADGYGAPGGHGGRGGGPGGSAHTPVTGDELTRVKDAVKAKDSAVTVTSVQKDPDGSYDVYGTKAGAQVGYDVSADLKTFIERTGGRGGHGGPGGGSAHTPVTGDELSKVTAAVRAEDAAVTVTSVRKDPDGSYDVFGTKAGAQVMLEASADLKTITQNTASGRHGSRAPAAPGANA